MGIVIYFIIFVLFSVLILWTWNNAKEFKEIGTKIAFIIIGIIILGILTMILFNLSKRGVNYPNEEIVKEVRKMALLVFIPINGFISLPHIASLKSQVIDDKKTKIKIAILVIVFIIAMIIETKYLKNFQNGIIAILNSK